VGKPGFYVAVYNKGGKQKVGVLEETLMSEKEARERVVCVCKANQVSPIPLPSDLGESYTVRER
jgi:hypothetical protein